MHLRIAAIAFFCLTGTVTGQNAPIIPEPAANSTPDAESSDQSGTEGKKADEEIEVTFRPMQAISLGNAISAPAELRLPRSRAAEYASQYGVIVDQSDYRPTPLPMQNVHLPWYQPLYFEDPNLERCGHHFGCLTDAVSAAWFFGRVPVLPYMKAETSPHDCVRSLGHCGSCQKFGVDAYLPPPDLKAAAVQAAATIGFVFLIP